MWHGRVAWPSRLNSIGLPKLNSENASYVSVYLALLRAPTSRSLERSGTLSRSGLLIISSASVSWSSIQSAWTPLSSVFVSSALDFCCVVGCRCCCWWRRCWLSYKRPIDHRSQINQCDLFTVQLVNCIACVTVGKRARWLGLNVSINLNIYFKGQLG